MMDIAERTLQLKEDFDAVYKAGKASAGVINWDFYQMNGYRTAYSYAFAEIWDDENFAPDYDIKPTGNATGMFYASKITDLAGILEQRGRKLDTSGATTMTQAFFSSSITHLPEISLEGAINTTDVVGVFALCRSLISVDMLKTSKSLAIPITNAFAQCTSLTHFRVDYIGASFSIQFSPLDVDSLKSIATALADYSSLEAYHYTFTLTVKATAFAALEEEGATAEYNGVACTWRQLITDHKKWNFTTV